MCTRRSRATTLEPKVRNVGLPDVRRRVLLRGVRVRRPESVRHPRAVRRSRQHQRQRSTTTAASSSTPRNTGSNRRPASSSTPRNTQYDAITDDSSNEDASPDFFWDSATRRSPSAAGRSRCASRSRRSATRTSIRRPGASCSIATIRATFTISSSRRRMPRGSNCFVCRANALVGLEQLPAAGTSSPRRMPAASSAARRPRDAARIAAGRDAVLQSHVGVDVKYLPNADNAIDLTVKPDFSQVESDTAQISPRTSGSRCSFPRSVRSSSRASTCSQTPIQAVYTRTITAPVAGGRVDRESGGVRYTVLVADDAGGGSAILPGPNGSAFAPHRLRSTVFIARAKRDIGLSFISVLATDRSITVEASPTAARHGGYNRVVGPDFQWRPSGHGRRGGAVALQRHEDAEPSRSRGRVDRAGADGARVQAAVEPQHDARRLVRAVPRHQRRVSRRHRLHAAGGLPRDWPAIPAGRSGRPTSCRGFGPS